MASWKWWVDKQGVAHYDRVDEPELEPVTIPEVAPPSVAIRNRQRFQVWSLIRELKGVRI